MKHPIIRTIYLYLFALVGLALLASGTYSFVDLGLRTYIFTAADQEYYRVEAPVVIKVVDVEPVEEIKVDYAKSQRQRQASSALARILVGFPLYIYHWGVIKKDTRKFKIGEL